MHDEGTNSKIKIFANIFISFIGAGILGLPYAFKEVSFYSFISLASVIFLLSQAGLLEGLIIMSAVGAIR